MFNALLALVIFAAPQQTVLTRFRKLQDLAQARIATEQTPARSIGDSIQVGIDPRIELLSIIFRLAGSDEFRNDGLQPYAAYIDHRFGKFKQHPAVALARKVREERGVCCDAVVNLAIHLTDPPSLKVRVPLAEGTLKERWRLADVSSFTELARDFAAKSEFEAFFRENKPLYLLTEMRMRRLVGKEIDPAWFARFFGERNKSRFIIAPGLLNGGISYGMKIQPKGRPEEMVASMGTWQFDKEGLPVYSASDAGTIVHEFNHSFVNPVVNRHKGSLQAAGEAAQKEAGKLVPEMAYFYWQTMIEETLVRAVVARYILARNGANAATREIEEQNSRGFIWLDDVYSLLGEYEKNRSQYRTFESFLPRVEQYFAKLPQILPGKAERFDALRPKVLESTPTNGAEGVDPKLTEIRITFDRPMNRGAYSVVPAGKETSNFPVVTRQSFDKSGTVFVMKVQLQPGESYELWVNSPMATGFRDASGIILKPHRIRFSTFAKG